MSNSEIEYNILQTVTREDLEDWAERPLTDAEAEAFIEDVREAIADAVQSAIVAAAENYTNPSQGGKRYVAPEVLAERDRLTQAQKAAAEVWASARKALHESAIGLEYAQAHDAFKAAQDKHNDSPESKAARAAHRDMEKAAYARLEFERANDIPPDWSLAHEPIPTPERPAKRESDSEQN